MMVSTNLISHICLLCQELLLQVLLPLLLFPQIIVFLLLVFPYLGPNVIMEVCTLLPILVVAAMIVLIFFHCIKSGITDLATHIMRWLEVL